MHDVCFRDIHNQSGPAAALALPAALPSRISGSARMPDGLLKKRTSAAVRVSFVFAAYEKVHLIPYDSARLASLFSQGRRLCIFEKSVQKDFFNILLNRGVILAAVLPAVLFDKRSQFFLMFRQDVCELNAHARRSRIAMFFRPYDPHSNGHDRGNAGQLKLYGKGIIDRQGVAGHNKCAGNAYVAYAGCRVGASMAGHDFQGGFYAFCLSLLFHGLTLIFVFRVCIHKG
jgi:hypothetical protein